MRRNNRKKNNSYTSIYITGGVLILAIATFVITFILYSNKLNDDLFELDSEYLAQYTNTTVESDITSASSSIGKTVEESEQEMNNATKTENVTNAINKNTTQKTANITNAKKETKKEPTFTKPIEGEILKEYAKDSLVYSETLKEWTTHLGIDIKAERASIVKASADGTIKYIKNDPRYGLTVIIEHSNGFETRYCNLLTTEFVSEDEEVKAGQTIGTVGDSAVYEIVDECHLHFEILKNGENLNPSEYVKY